MYMYDHTPKLHPHFICTSRSSDSLGKQTSSVSCDTSAKSGSHSINGRSHSHSGLIASSDSVSSEKVGEWSRMLFKCIKPVGEPEFRLNGDIGE